MISTDVTHPVTAGAGGYAADLTITGTGAITPTGAAYDGATALSVGQGDVGLNYGAITGAGGAYGKAGGTGVVLASGSLLNQGIITGGHGGDSPGYSFYAAGAGGAGAMISGASLINDGTLIGGHGGNGYFHAGAGGAGAELSGGTLVNNGTIIGGGSGLAGGYGAAGNGAGVIVTGGTLINNGAILTGSGGGVYLSGGTLIDRGGVITGGFYLAIQFGAAAATLALYGGARLSAYNALVVGNTAVNDTLILAAENAGTISGLGSRYIGLTTIDVAAGSQWTLSGSNSFAGTVTDSGSLSFGTASVLSGPVEINAGATLAAAGTLAGALTDNGVLDVTTGTLALRNLVAGAGSAVIGAGAVLSASQGGNFGLNASGAGTLDFARGGWTLTGTETVQKLVIGAHATLTTSASLTSNLSNFGTLDATGAAVTFSGTLLGRGTTDIGRGTSLTLETSAASAQTVQFLAAGALDLATPGKFAAEISGFGSGDVIDLLNKTVTSESYANNTLTLFDHARTVATLHFNGNYTLASFAIGGDGHGGTDISFQ